MSSTSHTTSACGVFWLIMVYLFIYQSFQLLSFLHIPSFSKSTSKETENMNSAQSTFGVLCIVDIPLTQLLYMMEGREINL